MKRHLLVLAFALPVLVAASREASANPDLEASLRLEADAIGGIVTTIDTVLATATRGKLSDAGVAAHREAKELYQQADALCRARKYEGCYRKLRAAKQAVMPAAREVLALGVAPDVRRVIASELETAARRIAGIATLLRDRATPEATAAYKQAVALYQEGKALYANGHEREAFAKLEPALAQLDIAIRAVWTSSVE